MLLTPPTNLSSVAAIVGAFFDAISFLALLASIASGKTGELKALKTKNQKPHSLPQFASSSFFFSKKK